MEWRNPLYGHSWYLDQTAAGDWYGMVWGDYDAVAPVCTNRKLLYSQVYRPTITQQLGIYSPTAPDRNHLAELYNELQRHRRYTYTLPDVAWRHNSNVSRRSNYTLALDQARNALEHVASKSQRQHIRQADQLLTVSVSNDVVRHISFVRKSLEGKYQMRRAEASIFEKLATYLVSHDRGYIMEAVNSAGSTVSSSLVASVDGYATLLLGGTSREGRELHARSLLVYKTIRRGIIDGLTHVDFEGSDIPGVAKFFSSFGAENVPYLQVSQDRMPSLVRWLRPS